MPRRRAPLLFLLLALALVAYPVTMPVAMAADLPTRPMSMPGDGQCAHQHQPAHHDHHALSSCCAGVCGSCPVISVSSGLAPRVPAPAPVFRFQNDVPATTGQVVLRSLPYSIGPPASLA